MKPKVLGAIGLSALMACSPQPMSETFSVSNAMRRSALEHSNIELMLESLRSIEDWHASHRTGIESLLRPGIDADRLAKNEAELDCLLPDELKALWQWRDGHVDTNRAHWLVWYHQLMPAEEALEQHRYLLADPMFGWQKRWIPVMQFPEEWYFVECSQTATLASPLMFFFIEQEPMLAYSNLTSYFVTANAAMTSGAVFVAGEDAEMDSDIRVFSELHARWNPGIAFPYAVPEQGAVPE